MRDVGGDFAHGATKKATKEIKPNLTPNQTKRSETKPTQGTKSNTLRVACFDEAPPIPDGLQNYWHAARVIRTQVCFKKYQPKSLYLDRRIIRVSDFKQVGYMRHRFRMFHISKKDNTFLTILQTGRYISCNFRVGTTRTKVSRLYLFPIRVHVERSKG